MKTKQLLNVAAALLSVLTAQTARAATIAVSACLKIVGGDDFEAKAVWRDALAKSAGILLLASAGVTSVAAGWTPPESSVTAPAVVTLDAFPAPYLNGVWPQAALVVGPDGALYGSASGGGSNDLGTLFRLEINGTFTKLHDFNYADGDTPVAAMVVGLDGALYGSAVLGGTNGVGTLFRLEINGTFTVMHVFNGTDGANPYAALVVGSDGALYGSTSYGGTNNVGTLFRLETDGTFTKVHDFGGTDGSRWAAAMVVGPDGALYGSTLLGGTNGSGGSGTLFRLETNGKFTTLHVFNGTNGASPNGPLVVGPDGALYGSTVLGGTNDAGSLFRLETNGTFTVMHVFNDTDGANPYAALVVGPDGALYGSTLLGGTNDAGSLFRLQTNGTFTVMHVFNDTVGAGPYAALVVGPDGALYGSTVLGGTKGSRDSGTLFRLETNGTFTHLYTFDGAYDFGGIAAMVVGPDAALYGSHSWGAGSDWGGILFKLVLDGDGDGVPDLVDQCLGTPVGAAVDATGCSIGQLVPCEGPQSGGTWKNHGQYVSAVVEVAKDFLNAGLITRKQRTEIVTGAAHSECGHSQKK